MANQFPTLLNNYTGSETTFDAGHAQEHNALEVKIGIGASTPTSGKVLTGGVTAGSSSWETPTAVPVKATGAEITTGTDDAKFATPKALADAGIVRNTARVQSVADAATITPNADTNDCVDITAIAQGFTIANPTGTPTNFQKLIIRIKDDGTPRAITFGNGYVAGGVSLPTTTVTSKILNLGFIYNTANTLNKWQLVASSQEA